MAGIKKHSLKFIGNLFGYRILGYKSCSSRMMRALLYLLSHCGG